MGQAGAWWEMSVEAKGRGIDKRYKEMKMEMHSRLMRDENTKDEMNNAVGGISRRFMGRATLLCTFREFKSDLLDAIV